MRTFSKRLFGELFRVALLAEAVHEACLVDLLLLVCPGELCAADFARKVIVVHSSTPLGLGRSWSLVFFFQERNKSLRQPHKTKQFLCWGQIACGQYPHHSVAFMLGSHSPVQCGRLLTCWGEIPSGVQISPPAFLFTETRRFAKAGRGKPRRRFAVSTKRRSRGIAIPGSRRFFLVFWHLLLSPPNMPIIF